MLYEVITYNEDRFDDAARNGNMLEVLQAELAEGRALFEGRIPAEVRSKRNFIMEELERVAAKRRAAAAAS